VQEHRHQQRRLFGAVAAKSAMTGRSEQRKEQTMNLLDTTVGRRTGVLALAALLSGVGVGTALADPAGQPHDYFAQAQAGARPDDRAGARGPGSPSVTTLPLQPVGTAVRPDDRAGTRGVRSLVVAATLPNPVAAGSGFDWDDAGIGAAGMFGLILIGSGLVFIGVRRRHQASTQSPAARLQSG
jgi:hypothetical protein